MNETRKRREWIKTAAIVFLSVLLLLTFFSGTIQNYSLPEVAVAYTTSDTVSSGIRVSGTVSASRTYNVTVDQTRTVKAVNVRNGDEVAAGDVLLELENEDSEELTAARKQLEQLQADYQRALLTGEKGNTTAEAQAVTAAEAAYHDAVRQRDNFNNALAGSEQQLALDNAKTTYDYLQKWHDGDNSELVQKVAVKYFLEYVNGRSGLALSREELFKPTETQTPRDTSYENLSQTYKTQVDAKIDTVKNDLSNATADDMLAAASLMLWRGDEETAILAALGSPTNLPAGASAAAGLAHLHNTLAPGVDDKDLFGTHTVVDNFSFANLKDDYASLYKDALAAASGDITACAVAIEDARASLNTAVTNAETALNNAKAALDKAAASNANTDKLTQLDLEQKRKAIADQQQVVDDLVEKFTDAVITAKQAGIVGDLIAVAGEKLQAGSTVCSIQLADTGYTVDLSVTGAQAQRVTVGSEARVSGGYYWGEPPRAVVASIRNDPNTRGNRLITLNMSGSVEAGSNYNFILGETSANYDVVVPKSAVREDNTGTFVLVVTNKSTPLGTRYYVTRTDVTVLAQDDTRCAVSGEFSGWDYVVTSSSAPIQAGDQVRLANS